VQNFAQKCRVDARRTSNPESPTSLPTYFRGNGQPVKLMRA
jgi:hypothetical protein